MKETKDIEELFRSKLANHETPVNDALWNGVQSKMAAAGAASTVGGGMSLLSKVLIGVSIATAVTITTIVVVNSNDPSTEVGTDNDKISSVDDQLTVKENNRSLNESTTTSNATSSNVVDDEEVIQSDSDQDQYTPTDMELDRIDITLEPIDQLDDNLSVNIDKEERSNSTSEGEGQTEHVNTTDPDPDETGVNDNNDTDGNATEAPVIEEKDIYLPDVFTPNGDGNNDEFFIETEGLTDYSLVVMDQQNKVVFQTSDPLFKWRGIDLGGNPVPEGQYIYVLTAKDQSGQSINKYSRLLIKR